ncbi:MAG: MMPL family transporter [Candidatus Thermoplasmatota archaeon]|nr:MMPL family transporter [Candidatus Thermoplasmatota archaeon]
MKDRSVNSKMDPRSVMVPGIDSTMNSGKGNGIMRLHSRLVTGHPLLSVILILLITVASIGLMTIFGVDNTTDEDTFSPDLEISKMNYEMSDRFVDSYSFMTLIRGPTDEATAVTPGAFADMLRMENFVLADPQVREWLYDQEEPAANVFSPASMVGTFLMTSIKMQMGLNDTSSTILEQIALFSNMTVEEFQGHLTFMYDPALNHGSVPDYFTSGLRFMFTKGFDPANGMFDSLGCMVIINFKPEMADLENSTLEQHISDVIVDGPGGNGYLFMRPGPFAMKVISQEIMDASLDSMAIILPIAFLLVAIILAMTYRDLFDIIISLTALAMAIIWMYGFGSVMGMNFNAMTTAVPVLLVGLGIDYGIHVTMRYREEVGNGRKIDGALSSTIISVGAALGLATITTAISFLSNLFSPMEVFRTFGLMAVAGIISSFITMTVFVPGAKQLKDIWFQKKGWKLWMGQKREDGSGDLSPLKRVVLGVERGITLVGASGAIAAKKAPAIIIIAALIITLGGAYGWTQVGTQFDFRDFLPEDLQISKDVNFMLSEFELTESSAAIYFKGDITQPDVFYAIEEVNLHLADTPHVAMEGSHPKSESVLTMFHDLAHYTGAEGVSDYTFDPAFMVLYDQYFNGTTKLPLPGTTAADIEGMMDHIMENSPSLGSSFLWKDPETGKYAASLIRVDVSIDMFDEAGLDRLLADMTEDMGPLEDSPFITYSIVTGGPVVTNEILQAINDTQMRSIVITIVASAAVMILVFIFETRNLKLDPVRWIAFGGVLGFLTMVPVMLCMVWIMGSMYLMDINLDVMSISITALTIGLGITYGIHYTHRFLEDLQKHKDVHKALRETSEHSGLALLGAAATTIAAFGMLYFSLLPPLKNFGLLVSLTIFYSLFSAVMILPSMLAVWGKLLVKRGCLVEEC